jgi:hypothetical protein
MADNNEHEELIDYDEEEVRAILIDWLINSFIHSFVSLEWDEWIERRSMFYLQRTVDSR